MLCCVVCWGFKVVLDPFVHILEYMLVEKLWFLCLSKIGKVWREAEQGSAILENPASAAEGRFGRRTC